MESKFCTNCGCKLEDDSINFCTNCGQKLEDSNITFCPNCGKKLNTENDAHQLTKTTTKKPLPKGILVGIGSVFIVLLLLFVFVMGPESNSIENTKDNVQASKNANNTETSASKAAANKEKETANNKTSTAKSLRGMYYAETTITEVTRNNKEQKEYTGKTKEQLITVKKSDINSKDCIINLKSLQDFNIPVYVELDEKNCVGEFVSEKYAVQSNAELTPAKETGMVGHFTSDILPYL
ncbi:MAG: zinc ribbon domain-containing protein, partial [Clostridiales bacterium]|nr:zinc ribbon domain-containing protein [Clostridiales bacterium]